jgi:hypothetical protein
MIPPRECRTGPYPNMPEQTNPQWCVTHDAFWSSYELACAKAPRHALTIDGWEPRKGYRLRDPNGGTGE